MGELQIAATIINVIPLEYIRTTFAVNILAPLSFRWLASLKKVVSCMKHSSEWEFVKLTLIYIATLPISRYRR